MAAYGLLAIATGLAWIYLVGSIAVSIGFAAVGVVHFARKKWLPGVICLILALSSALVVYGYVTVGEFSI
ncbi:MAG: hypothetical protein LBG62_00065 [Candidatus Methanoplasma sp.]|nr:hypothetical protein [Candidatus Methanoplasma sp.]